jgi:glycosyltransferase involved in cell wall biosynthesis
MSKSVTPQNLSSVSLKNLKIAVFHAFFVPKGGGEKLIFDIRDYYQADLYAGALDSKIWDKNKANVDSFVKSLYDPKYSFSWLHEDSKIPIWRKIKRQLFFLFSSKIKVLKKYDLVIFSGNVALIPSRIKNPKTKMVMYCHTPPRPFTDQLSAIKAKKPFWMRPVIDIFANWVKWQYRKDLQQMDLVISNSENTKNRLLKHIGVNSEFIFPGANTNRFKFIEQGDYYISWGRIEPLKRIPLILEAFAQMPDKKLIICSTGPLKDWLIDQIQSRNLKNIVYEGLVSDERLAELVGKSLAGIYIPVDEDAGITQIEIMSAGKPVIGVAEGGIKETVIDAQTGVLIPANPTQEDLIKAIKNLSPAQALAMRSACEAQAAKYDTSVFFQKMNEKLSKLY